MLAGANVLAATALALAVCTTAAGADVRVAVGSESSIGDRYLVRRGALFRATAHLGGRVSAGLEVGVYPNLGHADWTWNLAQDDGLVGLNGIGRMLGRFQPMLGIRTVDAVLPSGLRSSITMFGGVGLVLATDDLGILNAEGDPSAEATRNQVLPVGGTGVVARLGAKRASAAVRWSWVEYLDGVRGVFLDRRSVHFLGMEIEWTFTH